MTSRYAVFVDAGYLIQSGQWAVSGSWRMRCEIAADVTGLADTIKELAAETFPGKELLRVYWYDGAPPSGPTDDHRRLAVVDDVSVCLGTLTPGGGQKGVDTLAVLDMYDLARDGVISDVVLISGDGDMAEGVNRARRHGARTFVWSFDTEADGVADGKSTTSDELRMAADRHTFLDPGLFAGRFSGVSAFRLPEPPSRPGWMEKPLPADVDIPEELLGEAEAAAEEFGVSVAGQLDGKDPVELVGDDPGRPRLPRDVDSALIRFVIRSVGFGSGARLPDRATIMLRRTFAATVRRECGASRV